MAEAGRLIRTSSALLNLNLDDITNTYSKVVENPLLLNSKVYSFEQTGILEQSCGLEGAKKLTIGD